MVHRGSLLADRSDSGMGRQDHQRRKEGSRPGETGQVVGNSEAVVDGAAGLAVCCLDAVAAATAVPNECFASVMELRSTEHEVIGSLCLRRKATENIHTVLRSRDFIMIYIRKFCIIDWG
jgi:hypothetical protein